MISYEEYHKWCKYTYNEIGLAEFEEGLKSFLPHVDAGYVCEKWEMFRIEPTLFLGTYDKELWQYFYDKMLKENYRG